ncbi:MAG: hypothetical protein IT236_12725 [Bacteroidia bacterium]|nr:hypothetical protein [Bacteroidia bacterium]
MKRHLVIAAALLSALSSCKNPQLESSLILQRDSLMAVITEREMDNNDFILAFTEVEKNLDSVMKKQRLVLLNTNKTGDLKQNRMDKMNSEIAAINRLMEENKKRIKEMNGRLNSSDSKNKSLKQTINLLNNQLNARFAELSDLNIQLSRAYDQVDFLQATVEILVLQNMEQELIIDSAAIMLRTAYYIVAKMEDLKRFNLVDKQGGFLGMGKTAVPDNNPDVHLFTKIDYLQVTTIEVNSKHPKIISTHPSDSYELSKTNKVINSIRIIDPEKFWSQSKYLIVSK